MVAMGDRMSDIDAGTRLVVDWMDGDLHAWCTNEPADIGAFDSRTAVDLPGRVEEPGRDQAGMVAVERDRRDSAGDRTEAPITEPASARDALWTKAVARPSGTTTLVEW